MKNMKKTLLIIGVLVSLAGTVSAQNTQIPDKVKSFITTRISVIFARFDAVNNRLTNLEQRISSRIAKLEQEGKDMSEAKNLLDIAKIKIEEAKFAADKSELSIDELIDLEEINKKEIKEDVKAAKESIKLAHEALINVVVSIKNTNGTSTIESI